MNIFQGVVEKVDDLDVYCVGSGSKCIIWNYDIFGFDSGRTRYKFIIFIFDSLMNFSQTNCRSVCWGRLPGHHARLLQGNLEGSNFSRCCPVHQGSNNMEQTEGGSGEGAFFCKEQRWQVHKNWFLIWHWLFRCCYIWSCRNMLGKLHGPQRMCISRG